MFLAARWRLTVVFTGVLVAILAAAGIVIYLTTESLIYDRVDADLEDKALQDMFLVSDDKHEGGDDHGGPPDDEGPTFNPGGYFFAIVDGDGNLLESSGNLGEDQLVSQDTLDEAKGNGNAIAETTDAYGETQRVYVVFATDNGQSVFLQEGRSIHSEQDALSQLRTILFVVVLGSIVPALAGGYVLSGRALRPIKRSIESQRAFIADASHELRTPVAVVRTNAELLERHIEAGRLGKVPNDTRAVQDIISETERMSKLVGQMLTLAQADAGQSILSLSGLRVDELADEVGRSMSALAQSKGIELTVETTPGVWVNGDRDRLREVMVTLLDNAIKYTDGGGRVRMTVERAHRKAVISVSDTGQGIPPEALAHVFERFYRADKARSRDEGGTGLGLAIARHIVTAHGGEIQVESEPGKGTKIIVELRLLARDAAPETTRLPEATA